VTAATTTYLRYHDEPPRQPAAIEVGDLLSPVPDAAAARFVAPAPASHTDAVAPPPVTVALPPPRPKIASLSAKRAPAQPAAAQAATAVPDPIPVLINDGKLDALDTGAEPSLQPIPYVAPAKPERTILGVMVPDMVPTGDDVLRRVRGLGDAATRLVP